MSASNKQSKCEEVKYMGIKPLGDKVVIKALASEKKTKSGIVLPDTAQEKPLQGEVVAVGSGKVLENGQKVPLEVAVGDRVIYSKYGGTEIKLDGEEYLIMNEREILAIIQ
jgi:chaperonin GroES